MSSWIERKMDKQRGKKDRVAYDERSWQDDMNNVRNFQRSSKEKKLLNYGTIGMKLAWRDYGNGVKEAYMV